MGPGHTIVTVLCDTADNYKSKLYDEKWLKERGLEPSKYKTGRGVTNFIHWINNHNFTDVNPKCIENRKK